MKIDKEYFWINACLDDQNEKIVKYIQTNCVGAQSYEFKLTDGNGLV